MKDFKILGLLLLIVISFFLVIGSVNAENLTGSVNSGDDNTFLQITIDGETFNGYCVDPHKDVPDNTESTITLGTGGISDDDNINDNVKNIIVKYYRYDDNYYIFDNVYYKFSDYSIQKAIWDEIDGVDLDSYDLSLPFYAQLYKMRTDHTGVVGDTYTDENGVKYNFIFGLAVPITEDDREKYQRCLFFKYTIGEFPDPFPAADILRNSYRAGQNSNLGTLDINNPTPNNAINPVFASMEKTGIPILAILLVLLPVIGLSIRRKQ